MAVSVPLPHSGKGPYKGNYWGILEKDMKLLIKEPTLTKMEEIILKYINRSSGLNFMDRNKLQNLREVFDNESTLRLVPFIAHSVLQLPVLFPEKCLEMLKRREEKTVQLTRLQISCLLANMLFCTFQENSELAKDYRGHFTGERAPTGPLTFKYWLKSVYGSTIIYLQSLVNYFTEVQTMAEATLSETVKFKREVCKDDKVWNPKGSTVSIVDIEVHLDGRIGDKEQVEIDFANQHVGFGTTGTQEELMLGTSPELCAIVLFNEVLEPHEAIVMVGAKKYGDFTGYGHGARYSGPFQAEWNWKNRKIIAIDAICNPKDQLGDSTMRRELKKAWTGFQAGEGECLSTGHWGCGAFGGAQDVKCLVQVMAASLAGVKKLDFYSFGDQKFHTKFVTILKVAQEKDVGWIWEKIEQFRKIPHGNQSILDFIAAKDVL
eukprot:GFUD01123257.1.p1 GENE.GFUD01123257.1~~GFUD01123257.1.p1  ORF type:complete len:434 (-),score=91.69 GFUD01123257.1:106-1407(-)